MSKEIRPGDVLLKMTDIIKRFPGVVALQNAQFDIRAGEVHALLGENGAGKSTLMKVLTGIYQADEGTIEYLGKKVAFKSPKEAMDNQISMIYQEFNLLPHLSVMENIFIAREHLSSKTLGIVDRKKEREEAQKLLDWLGITVDPRTKVMELPVATLQMVEIAKALSMETKILIMDEPTAALTDREIQKLFEVIEQLKSHGIGIVYISHRMEELKTVADRVTVMRDGQHIITTDYAKTTIDELISYMVGRTLEEQYPRRAARKGDVILKAEHLSYGKMVKDVSFEVRGGEVLGVAGLAGAGRTEMAKIIFGCYPHAKTGGTIYVKGAKQTIKSPQDAIKHGIAYLTEDRKRDGLFLSLSVEDNVMISNFDVASKALVVNNKKSLEIVRDYIKKISIKTPSHKQTIKNLSGGNQQKVILARWLAQEKSVLIFDEPTRGIDVGAKREVYLLMNELAESGAAVIMISSDLPEVLGMSDRIMVMHEGRVGGFLDVEEANQEKILQLATGGQ